MNKILVITTGGTIDKIYSTKKGTRDLEIGQPAIERVIEYGRMSHLKIELVSLLKKDSLDMTDKDRDKIKQFIASRDEDGILITHGTDTMIQTGQILKEFVNKKSIVLVGSSLPEVFKDSDAPVNVGFAVGVLKSLLKFKQTGVYVCMNGEIFNVDDVEKQENGIFVKKN